MYLYRLLKIERIIKQKSHASAFYKQIDSHVIFNLPERDFVNYRYPTKDLTKNLNYHCIIINILLLQIQF